MDERGSKRIMFKGADKGRGWGQRGIEQGGWGEGGQTRQHNMNLIKTGFHFL